MLSSAVARARSARARSRALSISRTPTALNSSACCGSLPTKAQIEQPKKKLHQPGALPAVALADIIGRDTRRRTARHPDRMERGATAPLPKVRLAAPRRARPHEVAGVGDRALLRVEETGDGEAASATAVASSRSSTGPRPACLAFSVRCRPAAGGSCRSTKSSLAARLRSRATPPATPRTATWSRSDVEPRRGMGLADSAGRWSGSARSRARRAVSLIAIHAHDIPHVFRRGAGARPMPRDPRDAAGREDWRKVPFVTIDPVDAKDHDDAVTPPPTPIRAIRAATSSRSRSPTSPHYVPPGSALDREAQKRGNSVYFPDRVVPMLPERISNDLCSLRRARTARRWRCA